MQKASVGQQGEGVSRGYNEYSDLSWDGWAAGDYYYRHLSWKRFKNEQRGVGEERESAKGRASVEP